MVCWLELPGYHLLPTPSLDPGAERGKLADWTSRCLLDRGQRLESSSLTAAMFRLPNSSRRIPQPALPRRRLSVLRSNRRQLRLVLPRCRLWGPRPNRRQAPPRPRPEGRYHPSRNLLAADSRYWRQAVVGLVLRALTVLSVRPSYRLLVPRTTAKGPAGPAWARPRYHPAVLRTTASHQVGPVDLLSNRCRLAAVVRSSRYRCRLVAGLAARPSCRCRRWG